MTTVGLYSRISDDQDGTGVKVEVQDQGNRAMAALRGWDIGGSYIDNDKSAYQRKVVRLDFQRMLRDLAAGVIDGIVAYDLDRFARQPRDLEQAIDIYEGNQRGLVFATAQGDVNLETADGQTMARVMVTFANKASADTGRRTARKHKALAEAGAPVGGYRPFGWQKDKATLHPVEAAAMRQIIAGITAGKSIRSSVAALNDAGFETTGGSEWCSQTLRRYLRNPRLAGHRTRQGSMQIGPDGQSVRGLWTPLLTQVEFDRLQTAIIRPDTRVRKPQRNRRHYLLTGIVLCHACRRPMYGTRVKEGVHNYKCDKPAGEPHANAISGNRLDAMVEKLVLAHLADERLNAEPQATWLGEPKLAKTLSKIAEIMEAWDAETMSAEVAFPKVQRLEGERDELRAERAAWIAETSGPVVKSVTPDVWLQYDVDQQRAAIEKVIDAVLVRPAVKRTGNRMDPLRVVPVWRGSPTVLHAGQE